MLTFVLAVFLLIITPGPGVLSLAGVGAAYGWRQACYQQPYYRLVYGDGDNLPGLVIDRYGDVLVMQINTAGMMAVLEAIVSSLVDVLKPSGILLRNEKENTIEQLPAQTEVLYGEVPDFIDIHYMNYHWYVFNFADITITAGCLLVIVLELFSGKNKKENA